MAKKEKKQITEIIKKESTSSKIIDLVIEDLQKKFGDNVLINANNQERMNERYVAKNFIETDSVSFNESTGIGGIPTGRIFLLYGAAGCGKTHTSLAVYKSAEKEGYILLYMDIENRLDLGLVEKMGIDTKDPQKFILVLPNNANEIFEIIDKFLKTGKKFFIVFDSISALNIVNESKKANPNYGDGRKPGQTAKSISEFFPTIVSALSKSKSILFILSQMRMQNIVGYAMKSNTGGLSISYYATYILAIKKVKDGEILKDGLEIGQSVIMQFVKTSTSLPLAPRQVALKWQHGFYTEFEIAKRAEQKGLIQLSGHWVIYRDKKYNSFINFVLELEKDKNLFNELKEEINNKKIGDDIKND